MRAQRRLKVKMEAGYRMTGLLMGGCMIKTFHWERDLLILMHVMLDSLVGVFSIILFK